jgi:uncharacterized membrane protein
MRNPIMIKRFFLFARTLFFNGLFTILPIAFTFFFLKFTYGFVYQILEPLRKITPIFLQKIPAAEFFIATICILLLGFLLKIFVINKIVSSLEELVTKIPFVRAIYSSAKMVVDFFKVSEKEKNNKKVVMIHYPRKGNFHLAFLLGPADEDYNKIIPDSQKAHSQERYVKVFMPNSPNPTTGYFFIMPESEIILTEITFEEAIKTLVSCGLVIPETLTKS